MQDRVCGQIIKKDEHQSAPVHEHVDELAVLRAHAVRVHDLEAAPHLKHILSKHRSPPFSPSCMPFADFLHNHKGIFNHLQRGPTEAHKKQTLAPDTGFQATW